MNTQTVSPPAPCSPFSTSVSHSPCQWSSSAAFAIVNITSSCVHFKPHYTLHHNTLTRNTNSYRPSDPPQQPALPRSVSTQNCYECSWLCRHACMIDFVLRLNLSTSPYVMELLNILKPSGHYMYRTVVTICTAQWSLYVPPV